MRTAFVALALWCALAATTRLQAGPPSRELATGGPIQFSSSGIVAVSTLGGMEDHGGTVGIHSPIRRELFSYQPGGEIHYQIGKAGYIPANTPIVLYWQIDGVAQELRSDNPDPETTWINVWQPIGDRYWAVSWGYHDALDKHGRIDLGVSLPRFQLPFEQSKQAGRCGMTQLRDSVLYCINSFFDHQYPLQRPELGGSEPQQYGATIVPFDGNEYPDGWTHEGGVWYSGHDGYDFQLISTGQGSLVLAAAWGLVKDISDELRGNAIRIDHGNGYKTEYWHLSKILVSAGTVDGGTPIGVVGCTGRYCSGPHLHFVVKNRGPGGWPGQVVDPFGWTGTAGLDPWQPRGHGWCLWQEGCPRGLATAAAGGAVATSSGDIQMSVPASAVSEDAILRLDLAPSPPAEPSATIAAGYSFSASAEDVNGNPVTSFLQPLAIVINYAESALDYVYEATLGVYSWDELSGSWQLMSTMLDLDNNTATVTTDHLSLFALMGEPAHDAPSVTAITPYSGYTDRNTMITITGTNFLQTPCVQVGRSALSVTFVNSATLEAIVPAGLHPGLYTLTVQNPDTQTGSLADAFTVKTRVFLPLVFKSH